jgi:hypothetical protein
VNGKKLMQRRPTFRPTIDYPSLGVFQVILNKHFINLAKTLLDSKTLETLLV